MLPEVRKDILYRGASILAISVGLAFLTKGSLTMQL